MSENCIKFLFLEQKLFFQIQFLLFNPWQEEKWINMWNLVVRQNIYHENRERLVAFSLWETVCSLGDNSFLRSPQKTLLNSVKNGMTLLGSSSQRVAATLFLI